MSVESYQFEEAEHIRLGSFPVLDTILYRWARLIEESLFDQFGIEIYAGASVTEEIKFSSFYATLRSPKPIYFLEMEPLVGTALFVLDNRFANLCINQDSTEGAPAVRDGGVTLAPHNQQRLQKVVQRLMLDFDRAWQGIHPITTHLRKITTYLFRARILNAYERCLVAQVHLSGHSISARVTWCFPRIMLDPILDQLRGRAVIQSMIVERHPVPRFGEANRLESMDYRLAVSLGRLRPPAQGAAIDVGSTIPIQNDSGADAVVTINGTPLLVGTVGQTHGRYAVKITGPYRKQQDLPRPGAGTFSPIQWPSG